VNLAAQLPTSVEKLTLNGDSAVGRDMYIYRTPISQIAQLR